MFILVGSIGALIISALQIAFFCRKRNAGICIHCIVRNIFLINLISGVLLTSVFKYRHFLDTSSYGAKSFIKYFILSLVVGTALILIFAVLEGYLSFEYEPPKKKAGAQIIKILSAIIFILGTVCFFATDYSLDAFGNLTADQLLINLISPTGGAESGAYIDIFEGPVLQAMLVSAIFCIFISCNFKIVYKKEYKTKTVFNGFFKRIVSLLLSIAMLSGGIAYSIEKLQLVQLYNAYFAPKSDIIDDNYVDPRNTEITFPEQKRNLIHIYLESMENSYLSEDLGGYMKENLMPELTELSYEGITFSNNPTKFGGPLQATGTQWSVASMVNMTTGLPMKVPAKPNAYGSKDNFLPGAYTLGDLLKYQGYEQTVMFGADANFGGLSYYYQSHGDFKIMDYTYAKNEGLIPPDYKQWWGYEDDKLYEYAKNELTRLSQTGKPFHLVMETADTHRPGGYLSVNAPTPYDDHYANAIAYSQSETVKFVRWIQQQPFYENTTIVLIGDHLSMDTDFFEDFDPNYLRTQYNLILNPAQGIQNVDPAVLTNRQYANFDMFPTILSSIGVKIEGSRLGIGTDLFSGKKTIFEEYGYEKANKELEKKSQLYNDTILVKPESEKAE